MAFAQARRRDAHKPGVGLEVGNGAAAGIAHRRPQATVAGIQVRRENDNICMIRLEPMATDLDLSLERWSLQACEPAVEEAVGVKLRVQEPARALPGS